MALDWKSGWMTGGKRGPAIVPGKPDASLLIRAVQHRDPALKMPEEKLADGHVETLVQWVREGAYDDRTVEPRSADALDWWSLKPPHGGLNIRPRSEQVRAGAVVLPSGRRLRSHDLGLAAAAGATAVTVLRTLHVGVLSTGDELHDPPQAVSRAGQYDGNRPMLLAALQRAGYQTHDLGIVADRDETLVGAIGTAAARRLDAVVSTGGVAQGDADIVRRFPTLQFLPLALRPGRGLAWGRIDMDGHALWLFGLPGNSVAAYVIFQLIVAPLLAHLAGAGVEPPLTLQSQVEEC